MAGQKNAVRFFAGQIGRIASVLTETAEGGHSEHFVPVRVRARPGVLLPARITGANDDGLLAEPA
jgi:threonylcarbamoyladenosine tRNA methylthiotransferase MtaB